ncbi:MAG: hypothetical protein RML45_00680 [Acetobacteraceae bacterium]|nr:hypothetical protein [Acetobacteraceae bacterium]
MRVRTLRMVSLASLAAVSQSAAAALQAQGSRPVAAAAASSGGVERAKVQLPAAPAQPIAPLEGAPPGPLPRGSLLNLTV